MHLQLRGPEGSSWDGPKRRVRSASRVHIISMAGPRLVDLNASPYCHINLEAFEPERRHRKYI